MDVTVHLGKRRTRLE